MLQLGGAKLVKSCFANDRKILNSPQEWHRSLQSVWILETVLLYTQSKLVAEEYVDWAFSH